MNDPRHDAVLAHFRHSRDAFDRTMGDDALIAAIAGIAGAATQTLRAGGKVLLAGNGGSAADAQHIAAELVGRFAFDRAPLPAIALTTDTSALTAIGNDYGFEHVFERPLRALGRKGDLFIGISTSGRSPNVVTALKAAREIGVVAVGFMGSKGQSMRDLCDHVLVAPSDDTAIIQQVHITAAHAICGLVERDLFGEPGPR